MGIKALLVGINAYPGAPLRGCINDVVQMRDVLVERYGVAEGDITVLKDSAATTDRITRELEALAEGTDGDAETVRLFHFSGHGSYDVDTSGDEVDGRDEGLCPYDYDREGLLLDDTLRALYAGFGKKCHLLLVMDSCHSGTVQRDPDPERIPRSIRPSMEVRRKCREIALANQARRDDAVRAFVKKKLESVKDAVPMDKLEETIDALTRQALAKFSAKHYGLDTVKGNVVLIAGCRSNQTSADARFAEGYHGALSYHLLKALRRSEPGTYNDLIAAVGEALEDDNFEQEPQLECSRKARGFSFLRR